MENIKKNMLKEYLSKKELLELYRYLCLTRIAETIIRLEAKGLIDGTIAIHGASFSSLGEEAISVASCYALSPQDWVALHHRGAGGYFVRGFSAYEYFSQYFQKKDSLMHGFDGNIHMFDRERHFIRFISDMGASAPTLNGILSGLKYLQNTLKENKENPVGLIFFGDGAASQGVIHESMNYSATKKLPAIYIINNNVHAIDPSETQPESSAQYLATRAIGYGIQDWFIVDGNDVLDIYYTTKKAVNIARTHSRPCIIEARTYRLSTHNDTEDGSYINAQEYKEWLGRDPLVSKFKNELLGMVSEEIIKKALKIGVPMHEIMPNILNSTIEDLEKANINKEIIDVFKKRALERKEKIGNINFITLDELKEIEAKTLAEVFDSYKKAKKAPEPEKEILKTKNSLPESLITKESIISKNKIRKLTLAQAIREALEQEMLINTRIRVFGEDVAKTKEGVFRVTQGLEDKFGNDRVYNTTLSETQIVGELCGQALIGLRPVGEIQFFPFVQTAINQTHNLIGTYYYHTNTALPIIMRVPFGGGFSGGHYHSDCIEAYFYYQSGWKIVCPSNPYDAKGLLIAAMRDNSPVLFMEQIWAYHRGSVSIDVPVEPYVIPIGKANVVKEGRDITLVFYGALMKNTVVMPASAELEKLGCSCEVIDLRTVRPWEIATLTSSLQKTSKMIIIHEARKSGGIGESIAYELYEKMPNTRIYVLAALNTPIPQHPVLEAERLPKKDDLINLALKLLKEEK
jgi:pyruvate/2-oxoglutarate/acetoin dehydrogenase E1 component/TPP-dependent pyruvate/acetoin dehydrogenase alpha subunit